MNKYINKSPKSFGVMQGRLLPKYKGNYQAHPQGNWEKEFQLAKDLSLNCIEFILDDLSISNNPLLKKEGLLQIQSRVEETNVEVKSICADYFMKFPFFCCNDIELKRRQEIFKSLVRASKEINSNIIVLPCVDESKLKSSFFKEFVDNVIPIANYSAEFGVKLALETDLPPKEFKYLIDLFPIDTVFVNYDIGNSASLGYSIDQEFSQYAKNIVDIHIKDRILNGGPVFLGQGNADLNKAIQLIEKYNLNEIPLIMQAYRDEEGLKIFQEQRDLFIALWSQSKFN